MKWIENPIEEYLVSETRQLLRPCGSTFAHTAFRIHWNVYDWLARVSGFTSPYVVGQVEQWMQEHRVNDFNLAFGEVMAEYDLARRNLGAE